MRLESMKTGLASARQNVAAGKYVAAGFDCSDSTLQSFLKDFGAIAETKPDIRAFLDDYAVYCKDGMHLEAATALVTKAEASRATTPTGTIPECGSPDLKLAEVNLKDSPGGTEKLAPLKERYAKACAR